MPARSKNTGTWSFNTTIDCEIYQILTAIEGDNLRYQVCGDGDVSFSIVVQRLNNINNVKGNCKFPN